MIISFTGPTLTPGYNWILGVCLAAAATRQLIISSDVHDQYQSSAHLGQVYKCLCKLTRSVAMGLQIYRRMVRALFLQKSCASSWNIFPPLIFP